jgi:hypothetical protein
MPAIDMVYSWEITPSSRSSVEELEINVSNVRPVVHASTLTVVQTRLDVGRQITLHKLAVAEVLVPAGAVQFLGLHLGGLAMYVRCRLAIVQGERHGNVRSVKWKCCV